MHSVNKEDIVISLVSHNQKHHLERLLPTLLPAAHQASAKILLVDNRSVDGTSDFICRDYPEVELICNDAIAGYGANHNLNLKRSDSRYFVIMNSDMTVQADTFMALRCFMEANPEAGIVAPKILNKDGTIQGLNKRYPSIYDLFLRRFLPGVLKPLFRKRMDFYEMRDIGYERVCEVPSISGAFMFCRTSVLKNIGGFDEQYFLYFEDTDLCRRVQKTHKTFYCPGTAVVHFWERSAHKNMRFTWYFITSAWRYFKRWGFKYY